MSKKNKKDLENIQGKLNKEELKYLHLDLDDVDKKDLLPEEIEALGALNVMGIQKLKDEYEKKEKEDEKKEKKYKRNKKILYLIIVILFIMMLVTKCSGPVDTDVIPSTTDREVNETVVDIEDIDFGDIPESNVTPGAGSQTCSMLPVITFENGKAEGDLRIINYPENLYWQQVDIFLVDENKEPTVCVYESPLIPQGRAIEKGELIHNLPKGSFPAIARFYAIDYESKQILGASQFIIEIVVKNTVE